MESINLKVAISFPPLLRQITDALNLPRPRYRLLDVGKTNVAVFVSNPNSNVSSVYIGGPQTRLVASYEKAAELAVLDLLRKYHIEVDDITACMCRDICKRAGLNVLKRFEQELEPEQMCVVRDVLKRHSSAPFDGKRIHIDFVDTMHHIFLQLNITGVWIQTVETDLGLYTSWLTLPRSAVLTHPQTIYSDPQNLRYEAQQNCAQKVIFFLRSMYRFEVVDANYNRAEMDYDKLLHDEAAAQYLAVREALMPLDSDRRNLVFSFASSSSDPTASYQTLPTFDSSDLPPKKKGRTPREARRSPGNPFNRSTLSYTCRLQLRNNSLLSSLHPAPCYLWHLQLQQINKTAVCVAV